MAPAYRIGQIVPSSNTTMETEIPTMLRARETISGETFTFHSSRMRMKKVSKEELAAMDAESLRCAVELADARMDVIGYACLVAIMAAGSGYHRISESALQHAAREEGFSGKVVTSAGALVDSLKDFSVKRISIITPYVKPLTKLVADYLEDEGVEVKDAVSLEIPDNLDVGRHDPEKLTQLVDQLDIKNVDAVVLSACVQMPSLPVLQRVEDKLAMPVATAAAATVRTMLQALNLDPVAPNAGFLLRETTNTQTSTARRAES